MSFEKFTDKARKVLVLAQDEARALHQPYVGTEHILLGLIQEKDGLAAQALERLGVAYDAVVKGIREVASNDEGADESGHLSFTPRVKRVLENSLREAMQMGQSYISTEHLLLGIVRENEGTALDVLSRLGVKGDDIRTALNDLVGQSPVYAGRNPFEAAGTVPDSALKEFGTDLTQKARDGKLDPVIGRAGEIERVMQILSRRQKNNPLLIGEPDAAGHYSFTAQADSTSDQKALAAMKASLGLQQYATADEEMEKLIVEKIDRLPGIVACSCSTILSRI